MRFRSIALTFALITLVPTFASAQQFARNSGITLRAAALGPNTFEIVESSGAGSNQMWCAAGIYVRRVLGQSGGSISVLEPRGPSKSRPGSVGVVFTTDPVDNEFSGFSPSIRRAGLTYSMTHAFALCSGRAGLRLRLEGGQLIRRGI